MDCFIISSDSSSSSLINIESKSEINKSDNSKSNEFDLDEFLDDDIILESLESRIKRSQNTEEKIDNDNGTKKIQGFNIDDFLEDSNDFDTILNKISQSEAMEIKDNENQLKNTFTSNLDSLLYGNIIQRPITHNSYLGPTNSSSLSKSTELYKTTEINRQKSKRQQEQLEIKQLRKDERQKKKLEKENEKKLKSTLKVINSCNKPNKCIEYLTVNIDESLLKSNYGAAIIEELNHNNYNYKEIKGIVENVISWTRKIPKLENMILKHSYEDEKHFLLIMDIKELIEHLSNDTLISCIQSLLSLPAINHLTIAIFGLMKYLKQQSTQQSSRKKPYNNYPIYRKNDIEMKLIELQIFNKNLFIKHINNCGELALFVRECTKSVAQIPFKLTRDDSLVDENEYFCTMNKDSVRVDKNGNGLNTLWNQCLKMFPLANLEIAEAVTSIYPTLSSLMMAYKQCETHLDGEKLLENLPVRRAAGGGQRRIGPAFSKKAYQFFSTNINDFI